MARTQEDLQNDLDAIQSAKAKGVSSAQINGERVDFRSFDDMLRAEREIKIALGMDVTPRRRALHPQTRTGWR